VFLDDCDSGVSGRYLGVSTNVYVDLEFARLRTCRIDYKTYITM
jgi:hypothetical protein